jgi:hypothetical protein
VVAGQPFSLFIKVENPFEVPITLHRISMTLPTELLNIDDKTRQRYVAVLEQRLMEVDAKAAEEAGIVKAPSRWDRFLQPFANTKSTIKLAPLPGSLALDAAGLETPARRVRKTPVAPRQSATAVRLAPARVPQVAPTPTGQCGCGCGEHVRRRYRPGHDARHKEDLIRAALSGQVEAETRLVELGWSNFLENRRAAGR